MNSTYYNQNAQAFFDDTVAVDMTELYQKFTPYLPVGAHIVDAGCGSGRDTAFFLNQRYVVEAFDASESLVDMAHKLTSHTIQCCTFLQFTTQMASQDGIWACASLLHVPMNELSLTFQHLTQFLKPNGVLYCSFKYGSGEEDRKGRRFTHLNESLLIEVLSPLDLSVKDCWNTRDLRPGRDKEYWLNAILIKGQ
jgi:SAM-dependent methyltransferase